MRQQQYDVAIWQTWPAPFPDYVVLMTAKDALMAVEWAMRVKQIRSAARVAVRTVERKREPIERFVQVRVTDGGLSVVSCHD